LTGFWSRLKAQLPGVKMGGAGGSGFYSRAQGFKEKALSIAEEMEQGQEAG